MGKEGFRDGLSQHTGNTGGSEYSSEKGPILAEKIEERSEEWPGAESLQVFGVTNVWSVVLYRRVMVLITKLTMSLPGVPTQGDQFARVV